MHVVWGLSATCPCNCDGMQKHSAMYRHSHTHTHSHTRALRRIRNLRKPSTSETYGWLCHRSNSVKTTSAHQLLESPDSAEGVDMLASARSHRTLPQTLPMQLESPTTVNVRSPMPESPKSQAAKNPKSAGAEVCSSRNCSAQVPGPLAAGKTRGATGYTLTRFLMSLLCSSSLHSYWAGYSSSRDDVSSGACFVAELLRVWGSQFRGGFWFWA